MYIAENAYTARAFLKLTGSVRPLQETTIHTLSEKVDGAQICTWLSELQEGKDTGLVSEAGCPAVADPGAKVAAIAHAMGLTVRPWVGPLLILLGLMASGLDGQRFTFQGYAPVDPTERAKQSGARLRASRPDSVTDPNPLSQRGNVQYPRCGAGARHSALYLERTHYPR